MITVPIPYSNVEACRDAVAIILKDNLEYQYTHDYNPDADVQKVYLETTNPNDFTETSFIEVSLDNVPYSDKTYGGSVVGSAVINVDVYTRSVTTSGTRGDSASRLKCIRLLNLCRYILEDPQYKTLGFPPGAINGVSVESIGMADPEKYDTQNVSMGRLVFNVKVTENNSLLNGVHLFESVTEHRIGLTDEGFKYIT